VQTGTASFAHFYSQTFSRVFRSLRKQTLELSNSIVRDVNHRVEKYGYEVSKSKDSEGAAPLGTMDGLPALIFFAIGNLEFTIGIQDGPDTIAF
jgi:hypothetical protein